MGACGSIQHIFENSLTEMPTLLESLSPWNQIKPVDQSTFIEMFGELQFNENSQSSSSSSTPFTVSSLALSSSPTSLLDSNLQNSDAADVNDKDNKKSLSSELFSRTPKILCPGSHKAIDSFSLNHEASVHSFKYTGSHKTSDSFSSMNSESLQLCTEGLGFESFGDVVDSKNEMNEDWQDQQEKVSATKHPQTDNLCGEFRRSRKSSGGFPPPISCIGQSGKPWVCFKSYRRDGRFVLKEIRMPSQEFLHACREDGRLKLQFVQSNEDIQELDGEDYKEDEDDDLEDVAVDEEEENASIQDVGEEEREADTRRCKAGNELW